jgi:polyferredoxin
MIGMEHVRLAEAILAAHLVIIAFNIAGLVVIPVGAVLGWRIVRVAWLRLLHLALLAIVAGQALAGRACILTIWQDRLEGGAAQPPPMIMHFVNGLIYWDFPLWVFTILYVVVFLYVVALVFLVPFWGRHGAMRRSA